MKLLQDGTPGSRLFARAPVQGGAHLAYQTLHPGDREIDIDGKCGAEMLEHLLAIFRFSFEQELVNDRSGVGLFAQVRGSFLQVLGPVRIPARRCFQGIGALLTAC